MGNAAVPVSPWFWSIDANAVAPAHFSIDGVVRFPFAVGVSESIDGMFGLLIFPPPPCTPNDPFRSLAKGVGIIGMPACFDGYPRSWLRTSPLPPRSPSVFLGVASGVFSDGRFRLGSLG